MRERMTVGMGSTSTVDHEKKSIEEQNYENLVLKTPKEIGIEELAGRVCYFSLSGDQALSAFEAHYCKPKAHESKEAARKRYLKLKVMVSERLMFAVLMFDIVLMHCSDPLRSLLINELLIEHKEWLENGKIRFIANGYIKRYSMDYKNYIISRIQLYEDGYKGHLEAESLKQPHITDEYYEEIIKLLETSNYYIRKPLDERFTFPSLILNDLQPIKEPLALSRTISANTLVSMNKSLYELMHAKFFSDSQRADEPETLNYVFNDLRIITEIEDEIKLAIEMNQAVARPAVVDAIKTELDGNITTIQNTVLEAIAFRMDLLYCKMNTGNRFILEFHPSYEQHSVYKLSCFEVYLKYIANHNTIGKKISLTHELVNNILNTTEIHLFRQVFLSCMADADEQMDLALNVTGAYAEEYKKQFINSIKAIEINLDQIKEVIERR